MKIDLSGKTALVTGSTSGIGHAVATRLAAAGANVVVNGRAQAKVDASVAKLAAEISTSKVRGIAADVSTAAGCKALTDALPEVDILINNAGIFWAKPIVDTTEEEYDRMFAVNAKGQFFALQEAAKHMADGGRIVNISTGGTKLAFPGISIYGASKSALEFFTKVAAKELGAKHITVNTVSPGYTETDMLSDPQFRTIGVQASPLGRLGTPADIAQVVSFVVSDEAGWITGDTIQAGGGVVM